jgi:ubiquinone/menaquinone biosynthesis C-methylase UbiE
LGISRHDIFHWDVPVWSRAIKLWNKYLPENTDAPIRALELASNKGGLSLWMASKGFQVICSDVVNPVERTAESHAPYRDQFKIEYRTIDALSIPFDDNSFDVVMFKSFLGYLSRENQVAAIAEIKRVLKPGGVLLFAENLKGSVFHNWIRRNFIPWGKEWNYVTMEEIKKMVVGYSSSEFKSHGFISVFIRGSILKLIIYPIDRLLSAILPAGVKYVLFAAIRK